MGSTFRMQGFRWAGAALIAAALVGGTAADAAGVAAASTRASSQPVPGWPGGIAAYKGRYRLVGSSDTSFASGGELTIFSRIVPRQPKPLMSGILSFYSKDGTNVVYLTGFAHLGTALSARVSLGIYTGPQVGTLQVVSRKAADLTVRFAPLQGSAVSMRFTRISTNPHP